MTTTATNHARDAIRLAVRNAMQGAEELSGDMPFADYIAMMRDIAADATRRADTAAMNNQAERVARMDALLNELLDAHAAYMDCTEDGQEAEGAARAQAVDRVRESIIELLTNRE